MRVKSGRAALLDVEIPTQEDEDALKVVLYEESADVGVFIHALYLDTYANSAWACDQDVGIHVRPEQLDAVIGALVKAREILREKKA